MIEVNKNWIPEDSGEMPIKVLKNMKKEKILNIIGIALGLPAAILATIQLLDKNNLQFFNKASLVLIIFFLVYLYIKLFFEILILIRNFLYCVLLRMFSKKKKYGVIWKYKTSELSAVSFCPKCNIPTNQLIYGAYKDNNNCPVGVVCTNCEKRYLFLNLKNNPYPVDYAQKEMDDHFLEIRKKLER